jgi:Transglycosylase-like domain
MSVTRRKLIGAVSALGLGLCVAAQAAGSSALPLASAGQSAANPQPRRSEVAVLELPATHFHEAIEVARHKGKRARNDRTDRGSPGAAGSFPSPDSLGVSAATLESIAVCESGGDPTAVSADGIYRGKYQFDSGTWASVGGSGDPAAASAAEQDYRAALLYSRGGSSPWPVCGS